MKRIMVVVGHPQNNTFCEALGKVYRDAASAVGHEVRLFLLSAMAFDPILHEGNRRTQPLEPDLQAAHQALKDCDHLVFIFPLWCGDMPALLKGFIERILQPDLIAREGTENAMNWSIFRDKTARVIITMGMPVLVYRYWYRGHALKLLTRNILNFIGISPVWHTLFGMVADVRPEVRHQWVEKVRKLGQQAA
jgi:putative NADPH-quinone reductase